MGAPRRTIAGEKVITAIAGPDQLMLRGPRLPLAADHRHADEFDVRAGDELTFSTTWVPSHVRLRHLADLGDRIRETIVLDEELGRPVPRRPPARRRSCSGRCSRCGC